MFIHSWFFTKSGSWLRCMSFNLAQSNKTESTTLNQVLAVRQKWRPDYNPLELLLQDHGSSFLSKLYAKLHPRGQQLTSLDDIEP
jgi:hypothetical protein